MGVINREAQKSRPYQLSRRGNWADSHRGVVLVFVIVFIVGSGLLSLYVYRIWKSRKAEEAQYEEEEIK